MSSLPVVSQPVHRCAALLDHLARHMRIRGESALTPLGLRPRHLVALTILRDHAGTTQQSLAGILQIDRTNLVGLLNELERDGLIERRRAEDDRRRHTVALTQLGSQRLAEAEFALATAEDEVLVALDETQREALYALLQQASTSTAPDCAGAIIEPGCS
jgi:DNA-binding MarR family transcriptional regulator